MPLHYSSARYEHSLRIKHILKLALEKLIEFESWEVIPEQAYLDAAAYGRAGVDKLLQQEARVIWTAPVSKAEKKAKAAPKPRPAADTISSSSEEEVEEEEELPIPAVLDTRGPDSKFDRLSSSEEEVEEEEELPIPAVLDTRGPDSKFDRLATIQGKSAEAPSLVFENRAGGKLWLSGIPVRSTVSLSEGGDPSDRVHV
eukprot:s512_g9.t1